MRKFWTALVALVASLAAPLPALGIASPGFAIEVQRAEWGGAEPQDIERVLSSVASVLIRDFPDRASTRVRVVRGREGPRALFEKNGDGAYVIVLNVQGTRWDQFAYQFSHELCHILTNFEHREPGQEGEDRQHQWFEEALCEAVALMGLKRVAALWEKSPPYPHWRSYARAFSDYAAALSSQAHRHLTAGKTIREWYGEQSMQLARNPYSRETNEVLATRLLPLIEQTPAALASIAYLNRLGASAPESFGAFLKAWFECCPAEKRALPKRVMALFEPEPAA